MKFTINSEKTTDRGGFKVTPLSTVDDFDGLSGAFLEVDTSHGETSSPVNDRVYFVHSGAGDFMINGKVHPVTTGDMILVNKTSTYDIVNSGDLPLCLFLVHSPAYQSIKNK